MTSGGFLSQLGTVLGFLAAAVICFVVMRALWAEIGPMVRLMFRRASRAQSDKDDGIGLKQ